MPMKNDREYRAFKIIDTDAPEDYKVRGYASTFEPYKLFEADGVSYNERIAPTAFDDADMSDVIFLYNHAGMVYARQKNGTLKVSIDDHGLYTEADLGSTNESRAVYEAIRSGLIDQMSFAFTVAEDEVEKDSDKSYTRIVKRVGKVFDVSAVSIPANPDTDIAVARSCFDGVIEAEKAERLEREKRLNLAKAKFNFMEV